jgi:hypothetical protein
VSDIARLTQLQRLQLEGVCVLEDGMNLTPFTNLTRLRSFTWILEGKTAWYPAWMSRSGLVRPQIGFGLRDWMRARSNNLVSLHTDHPLGRELMELIAQSCPRLEILTCGVVTMSQSHPQIRLPQLRFLNFMLPGLAQGKDTPPIATFAALDAPKLEGIYLLAGAAYTIPAVPVSTSLLPVHLLQVLGTGGVD